MRHEDLGGRSIAQALARERIHMLGEGDELLLTDSGEIGIARHEAADALVGVFHGTFLPRRTGVAEPAPRADALFQSPESGKLRAAIKGEALPGKGWQGRERFDDLVHDRS